MARDARRAQVLSVAQELFAGDGYHQVSMDDIAVRAAVSKPVLYRHFPSKLELYLVVVEERGAELLRAVDAALGPVESGPVRRGDGRRVVQALVRAYFEFVEVAGESFSLLFESDLTRDAAARVRLEQAGAEAERGIARVLGEFTGLPPAQTTLLAATLVGMARTAATTRFRTEGGLDVEEAVDLVASLAWQGVAGLIRTDLEYDT
jgi:AcrR family transcriptional regulator